MTAPSHPDYLVDPQWVQDHAGDPNLVQVDIDGEAGYQRGHIAGAVMLSSNYERDSASGWVRTMSPDRFAATCQGLGIGDDTRVVVYDNNLSLYAARFWWVLHHYGHTNGKVLDGGWRRWVMEGRPVSFDPARANTNVRFTPHTDDSMLGRLEDVRAACTRSDSVVWDVRTPGEYDGSVRREGLRPGHVAGAVNLEWASLMDRETHRFKPRDEMRRLLEERGITPDKAVFSY
jgi:thiosulfate/3-mercaptopyruvate sulfurtransferase